MPTNKVLVFVTDGIPFSPSMIATGAGLRCWQILEGLRANGHEVVLAYPQKYYTPEMLRNVAYEKIPFTFSNQQKAIRVIDPKVIIYCQWGWISILEKPKVPMAIDLHGPHLLERYYSKFATFGINFKQKIRAFQMADFFTCAGEKQKEYFWAFLLLAGFKPDKEILKSFPVAIVTQQTDALPGKQRSASDQLQFVYGGALLPWQNPKFAINTFAEYFENRNKAMLHIFAGKHPNHAIAAKELQNDLTSSNSSAIRYQGYLAREKAMQFYRNADVALDLMAWNLERELAVTTRTVEYLWSGLPVIYNNFSDLSELIRKHDAGWCIRENSKEDLTKAFDEITTQPAVLEQKTRNAIQLGREVLDYRKVIAPLSDFCKDPHLNPLPPIDQLKVKLSMTYDHVQRDVYFLAKLLAGGNIKEIITRTKNRFLK